MIILAAIGQSVHKVARKPEFAIKPQTAKVVFHRQQLRNLAVIFRNALHTVGHVEIGQAVLQTAIKHALVIKLQIVRAGHNRQPLLNPALILQLALLTLGNAAVGELVRRKESKQEVAIKLMIVHLLKQQRQQLRNTAKLQTNLNNKLHRKI